MCSVHAAVAEVSEGADRFWSGAGVEGKGDAGRIMSPHGRLVPSHSILSKIEGSGAAQPSTGNRRPEMEARGGRAQRAPMRAPASILRRVTITRLGCRCVFPRPRSALRGTLSETAHRSSAAHPCRSTMLHREITRTVRRKRGDLGLGPGNEIVPGIGVAFIALIEL